MNKISSSFGLLALSLAFAGQAQALIRATCQTTLSHVVEGHPNTHVETRETFAEAETEQAAVDLAKARSLWTCRKIYYENHIGDPLDCVLDVFDVTCGYQRAPGAPQRGPAYPNPPNKAACFTPRDTCEFSSVASP